MTIPQQLQISIGGAHEYLDSSPPKQGAICAEALLQCADDNGVVLMDDLKAELLLQKKALNTRQKPYSIFSHYWAMFDFRRLVAPEVQ